MTLIDDSLEGVKTSILMAVKNELTETYPVEFGDYKTSRGDTYSKVYWADTVRYQPKYPYCVLTPSKDRLEGYDEISYFRGADERLNKKQVTRSFMTVSIDVYDMGNETSNKSSLQADTFAHKVARQLRKYFNGDESLDWFSGNKYYANQIGITVDNNMSSIIDWSDTEAKFRYSFDIYVGWDDKVISKPDLANGVKVTVDEKNEKIDEFTIQINQTL